MLFFLIFNNRFLSYFGIQSQYCVGSHYTTRNSMATCYMGGYDGTVGAATVYKMVSLEFKRQYALEFFSPLYPF